MKRFNIYKFAILVAGILSLATAIYAEEIWTLKKSVKQVLEASPRIQASGAEVAFKKAELSEANLWPNPEVGVTGSEKLGLNDQTGGSDLTQLAVSQPIPLIRLPSQTRQAQAQLRMQQELMRETLLRQEYEASIRFTELQFRSAKFELAKEQLEFAAGYGKKEKGLKKTDPLVRYLTPLEEKRLHIMEAVARQGVASAEGEYSEALLSFNTLLRLSHDAASTVVPLERALRNEALESLLVFQEQNHPALAALKHQEEAAKAGVVIAYAELFPDPVLTIFRERDFLDERRQDFYGVTLNFQVPLWDRKGGAVHKAKATVEKSKYDVQSLMQELESTLRESHLHLGHLIEQAEDYQLEILNPSEEVFELTRKGFISGEVNVLGLVDANNIYHEARTHYLELLYQAWLELAEMRLAAGMPIEYKGGQS